jgi:succinate-semialdehyde dehydrogenase / glutarate-semialdehyde dehydrogenase
MTTASPSPRTEQELIASIPTGLYTNGGWRAATDGGTLAMTDPSTVRR